MNHKKFLSVGAVLRRSFPKKIGLGVVRSRRPLILPLTGLKRSAVSP
jgi:hypothetical protein